ncbi:MAG: hypothetical protein WDM90_19090 [Ferruginibacter sp.]
MNRFKGEQQVSAIGMANNTNRQGFTFSDVLNFTGAAKKMMSGGWRKNCNQQQPG